FIPVEMFNDGAVVGLELEKWLTALGAEPVVLLKNIVPLGGPTEAGQAMLQDIILVMMYAAPEFIKAGILTQAQYEAFMQMIYNEITPRHIGKFTSCRTFAHKPR